MEQRACPPLEFLTHKEYRELYIENTYLEIAQLKLWTEQEAVKRMSSFLLCGDITIAKTRRCLGVGYSCHLSNSLHQCGRTTCPDCSSRRAKKYSLKVGRDVAQLRRQYSRIHSFQVIHFTTIHDAYCPLAFSINSLMERLVTLKRVVREIWDTILSVDGARIWISYECSPGGVVHAHAIYLGPTLEDDALFDAARGVSSIAGSPKIEGFGIKKSLRVPVPSWLSGLIVYESMRVFDYFAKGVVGRKVGQKKRLYWLAGLCKAEVCNPILASRWGIASFGKHLVQFLPHNKKEHSV